MSAFINKDFFEEEVLNTQHYFSIKSIVTTIVEKNEVSPDGSSLNVDRLLARAKGRDCYDVVYASVLHAIRNGKTWEDEQEPQNLRISEEKEKTDV